MKDCYNFQIDIKFEVYKNISCKPIISSLYLLEVIDVISKTSLYSYKDYKQVIEDLMAYPDFEQDTIENLILNDLEPEKLYKGVFDMKFREKVYINCIRYEVAKYE